MIMYQCPDFIVAFKPHGLPTVPLKRQKDTDTLLSRVGQLVPQVLEGMSEHPWEGGAVHRLDTDTEGLVLFAANRDFFRYMQEIQEKGLFRKTYRAVCTPIGKTASISEKFPEKFPEKIETFFRAFGEGRRRVKPETDIKRADSPTLYTTYIDSCEHAKDGSLVCTVSIFRGFRHQIRAHLAYCNLPIKGDRLYNPIEDGEELQLTCTGIEFPMPGTRQEGKIFSFRTVP